MTKVKLNKNTLREQSQAMRLYQELLPTLSLRKQQLEVELRRTEQQLATQEAALAALLNGARSFAPLLATTLGAVRPLVVIETLVVHQGNIAGVRVPVFDGLRFADVPYSLVITPPFFDVACDFWRQTLSQRAACKILGEQQRALHVELVKTTQRINLYEKVLIPECRINIHKIKVYLGDQQTAQVCRAKLAKAKILRGQTAWQQTVALASGTGGEA